MSTGDEFQDKIEDDLYDSEKQSAEKEDPVYMWAGRITIICVALAFIFCMVLGCVALWKAVF